MFKISEIIRWNIAISKTRNFLSFSKNGDCTTRK